MFGLITFGSFLATLFGIAFLELQAQKVDSADEVVAEPGAPVVGSLPMLPTGPQSSGVPADREGPLLAQPAAGIDRRHPHDARCTPRAPAGREQVVDDHQCTLGEGKTSLASHLSTSLARSGQRDPADRRRPPQSLDPPALRPDAGSRA